ncbi:MAG: OmpP1/FadL family transporter, partial [Bacteroidales bacterium]
FKTMKRILLIIIASFAAILSIGAQNLDDAIRYSRLFYKGTARFMSMGGAFTALGADLSAININPAGTGVFRSFEATITPDLIYHNSKANFNGTGSTDFKYSFGLNQAGFVTNIISNNETSGLVNLNFAYSYLKTNDFNENVTIRGISDNSSMAEYWAQISNGIYYQELTGSAGIAYDVWVMDTITGSGGTSYGTIFSSYGDGDYIFGQTIRRLIANEGYSSEHAFSLGANISEKFFAGASLTINKISYIGHYEHLEADYDEVVPDFNNFTYTDHLEAKGTGFAFKIGTIIRPVELLRIGVAFHTPVVYRIREYYYDQISSGFDNGDSYRNSNDPMRYSYTLTTPFKAIAGVAVQIKKLAIISADYEFDDYRMMRFSKGSDGYNYYDENEDIKNIFKSASNLKLGAEFRVNNFYLRGGYGLYGSAFASGGINKNLTYTSISFGAGFRQQNFFFDMAFANLSNNMKYMMYTDPPYLQPAEITFARNTFTATIGFKF